MTDTERNAKIKRLIEKHTAANTVSRDVARRTLIAEGIYTEDGELAAEYGGPGEKKAKDAA